MMVLGNQPVFGLIGWTDRDPAERSGYVCLTLRDSKEYRRSTARTVAGK
jgi:hypothetical protein